MNPTRKALQLHASAVHLITHARTHGKPPIPRSESQIKIESTRQTNRQTQINRRKSRIDLVPVQYAHVLCGIHREARNQRMKSHKQQIKAEGILNSEAEALKHSSTQALMKEMKNSLSVSSLFYCSFVVCESSANQQHLSPSLTCANERPPPHMCEWTTTALTVNDLSSVCIRSGWTNYLQHSRGRSQILRGVRTSLNLSSSCH